MKLFEIAQAFDEITNGGIFVDVYEGDGEVILTYDELRSYLMQGNVRDEKILSDAESRILFDRIVAVGSDDECGDRIDEIIASVLLVLCVMARRAFSISDYGNQSEAVEMIYRGFAGEFEEQMYAFGSPFLIQYGRTTFVSIVIEKEAADAIRSMVHLSIGPGSLMPHKGFVCPVKNSDFVRRKNAEWSRYQEDAGKRVPVELA